jgi:hypothetical protein
VLTDGPTLHILNAISPAMTSSIPFAHYAVSRLLGETGDSHTMPMESARVG